MQFYNTNQMMTLEAQIWNNSVWKTELAKQAEEVELQVDIEQSGVGRLPRLSGLHRVQSHLII